MGALAGAVTAEVTAVLVIFARLGSALMVMPGFGESYVPARLRLLLALALSLVLAPVLVPRLGPLPAATGPLLGLVAGEVVGGLLIGALFRVAMVAVHLGGAVIATQSGLAAAAFFDPHDNAQGTIGGNFLAVAALALVFATDAHHALLEALAASYAELPAGTAGLATGGVDLLVGQLAAATGAALRIAGPIVALSLLLAVAFGVLGRLVPAFQALFVLTPVQLMASLLVLAGSLAMGLRTFLDLLLGSARLVGGG